MTLVTDTFARYGASLNADGYIVRKDGKVLGLRPVITTATRKRPARIQLRAAHGLVASVPATAAGLADFLEAYWSWKPLAPAEDPA